MFTVGIILYIVFGLKVISAPPQGKNRDIKFTELEILVPPYLYRAGFIIPIYR